MWFHSLAGRWRPASQRRRPPGPRTRCACRPRTRTSPSPEALEDRSVPSGTPLPIPGVLFPAAPGGNPFGGPAVHFGLPGPADNTVPTLPRVIGGEPSTITDFNGFIGVAHVEARPERCRDRSDHARRSPKRLAPSRRGSTDRRLRYGLGAGRAG